MLVFILVGVYILCNNMLYLGIFNYNEMNDELAQTQWMKHRQYRITGSNF